jgi:predicted transposase YbfD/YdcC
LWVKKHAAEVIREMFDVPGCRTLIRLDKKVRRKGKEPSWETRYFISSLNPDEVLPEEFESYIRQHWEVENCLHLQKDKYFREDNHVLGADSWGEAWTILTNMAVSLVKLMQTGNQKLIAIRERCDADPTDTARMLGWYETS